MIRASLTQLRRDRRVRFLFAGGLAAGFSWLVRFPLNLMMPFAFAVVVAGVLGMAAGFFAYRAFVFAGSTRSILLQLRDFIGVNLGGMAITALVAIMARGLLLQSLDMGAFTDALAHAIGIAAGAVANYLGHARITFRDAR